MKFDTMKFWAFVLLPLLLTGCTPERPAAQPPMIQVPPPPVADISVDPLGGGTDSSGGSTLPGGSALPGGSGGAIGTPVMPDPMRGSADSAASTPDPLLASGDPLKGPAMPTQHSHWLSVGSGHARLIVELNGIRYGGAFMSGTHDVTMRLRPGMNTLSVLYQPQAQRAWASVVLTEGESGLTGRTLATFRQAPLPDMGEVRTAGSPPLPEITRTMIFTAK